MHYQRLLAELFLQLILLGSGVDDLPNREMWVEVFLEVAIASLIVHIEI